MSDSKKASPSVMSALSPLTRAIHGQPDHHPLTSSSIGPEISVSTTFKLQPPHDLVSIAKSLGEDRSIISSPIPRFDALHPEHASHDIHLHYYKRFFSLSCSAFFFLFKDLKLMMNPFLWI